MVKKKTKIDVEIVLGKNYTDTLRRKVLRTVMEDFRNEKIQK